MLYHYPLLSAHDFGLFRTPGPGLGNLLFPILRAVIGAQQLGGRAVYPTIPQFKLGTLLRNERDKRFYTDIARGRRAGEWADWAKARLARPVFDEAQAHAATDKGLIVYSGLKNYFHDLAGHDDLVRGWFTSNIRLPKAALPDYDIAMHIRLGDFAQGTGTNTRTPFDWYGRALEQGGQMLGLAAPRLLVFTDGDFGEVRKGLGRDDLEFDQSPHAGAALARMASAKLLIASRSTFSMWGAVLGGVPTIWNRDFDLAAFYPMRQGLDHVL